MTHPQLPEQPDPPQPVHTLSEEELFSLLGSSPGGLTSAQAQAGLARFGINDISRIRKSPLIFQYLGHFKNLLVIILLIAAAISLSVGEITNAAIIVIIVLASVTLNFFQE
jgi:magnesium-transporting ATPase (P-type)